MWSSTSLTVDGLHCPNNVSWNALSSCRIDWFNNKSTQDSRPARNAGSTQGFPTPTLSDTEPCYDDQPLDCTNKEDDIQSCGNMTLALCCQLSLSIVSYMFYQRIGQTVKLHYHFFSVIGLSCWFSAVFFAICERLVCVFALNKCVLLIDIIEIPMLRVILLHF